MSLAPHRRPNRVELDLWQVGRALADLRSGLGSKVRLMPALKADAYGFGTLPVARAALAAGADGFCLVDRAEAIRLREAGIQAPILLYAGSPLDPDGIAACERHRLIPTVLAPEEVDFVAAHVRDRLPVAVKVEVGTNRLGVYPDELPAFARRIAATGKLELAIVNAHPSIAEGQPDSVLDPQCAEFIRAAEGLAATTGQRPTRLFASSKVLTRTLGMAFDAVDPGRMLFADHPERPPIRRLSSRLIQVRGSTGVIPFGTVDGAARCHGPEVLLHGHRTRLAGAPGLEYVRVDLTGIEEARPGDEVVLIGRQGEAVITGADVGLRPSDIALALGSQVQRAWHEDGT